MQVFHFLVASLGSAMAIVVAVVVLIYYWYLDMRPELARDLPALWLTAASLALIGAGGWLAAWGWLQRPARRHWFAAANAVCLGLGLTALLAIYR